MAVKLVPIRVKIRVGVVGGRKQHVYPPFNNIDAATRKNMDWSNYLDTHGIGWHYDKCCGFGESDSYNVDRDVWYGATCVPEDFADAAVALGTDVEIITEAQFRTYYDDRAHIHEPEEHYDLDTLQAIKVKQQLGKKVNKSDQDAMDPLKENSGIRRNDNKTWALYKTKKGIEIVDEYAESSESSESSSGTPSSSSSSSSSSSG